MKKCGVGFLFVCLWAAKPTPASADVIPLEAILRVAAECQIDPNPLQYDRRYQTQYRTVAEDMSDAALSADHVDPDLVEAHTMVTAHWDSPSQGHVEFHDTGFDVDFSDSQGSASINGTSWSYKFTTQDEITLTMNYAINLTDASTGSTGLDGFLLQFMEVGQQGLQQVLDPISSGVMVLELNPNTTYTLAIFPMGSLSGDVGLVSAAMNAVFDWQIDSN